MAIINTALVALAHGVFDDEVAIKENTQKRSVYPLMINLDCKSQRSGILFILIDNASGYIGMSNGSNNFLWMHFSKALDCYKILAEVFYSNPYSYNVPLKLRRVPFTYEEWLKRLNNPVAPQKLRTNASIFLITTGEEQPVRKGRGYSFC